MGPKRHDAAVSKRILIANQMEAVCDCRPFFDVGSRIVCRAIQQMPQSLPSEISSSSKDKKSKIGYLTPYGKRTTMVVPMGNTHWRPVIILRLHTADRPSVAEDRKKESKCRKVYETPEVEGRQTVSYRSPTRAESAREWLQTLPHFLRSVRCDPPSVLCHLGAAVTSRLAL